MQADLVHLRWPDGVMQCELNVAADQKLELAENNRKTGSCPVLFTWNGRRFVCIGDFLGGGGLGYLVAPGVYSQPDRDEAMAVTADQLQPKRWRLSPFGHRADGRGRVSRSPAGSTSSIARLAFPPLPTSGSLPKAPDRPASCFAWRTAIEPVRAPPTWKAAT